MQLPRKGAEYIVGHGRRGKRKTMPESSSNMSAIQPAQYCLSCINRPDTADELCWEGVWRWGCLLVRDVLQRVKWVNAGKGDRMLTIT